MSTPGIVDLVNTNAANSLVGQRFLLQRDATRRIQRAQNNPVLP